VRGRSNDCGCDSEGNQHDAGDPYAPPIDRAAGKEHCRQCTDTNEEQNGPELRIGERAWLRKAGSSAPHVPQNSPNAAKATYEARDKISIIPPCCLIDRNRATQTENN